jgi:hypothetical protein
MIGHRLKQLFIAALRSSGILPAAVPSPRADIHRYLSQDFMAANDNAGPAALAVRPKGETMRLSHVACIMTAVILAAIAPALAQSDDAAGLAASPPARAANIYDHKDHQPTERDVPPAARAAASQRQVETEVQALLRQTDELDKQSEQRERLAPAGQ